MRDERKRLAVALSSLGMRPLPSEANFVYATAPTRQQVLDLSERLASRGIAVRAFGEDGPSSCAVRITCPGDDTAFTRLLSAILEGANP